MDPIDQRFVNYFTRAAIWQLMRRSPTWLLLAVVAGSYLLLKYH
jgi:hypothetical protein